MRKYRKTQTHKIWAKKYYSDYYKQDYARLAKNERQRKYRKIHGRTKSTPSQMFGYKLKYLYGISVDQYIDLLKSQNYRCRICRRHVDIFKKGFSVDHDHKTGKIRGLLCHHCNSALGNFQDKIQILQNAILYLRKFK